MANRLLDRHEVVTIDGDVGYTPTDLQDMCLDAHLDESTGRGGSVDS